MPQLACTIQWKEGCRCHHRARSRVSHACLPACALSLVRVRACVYASVEVNCLLSCSVAYLDESVIEMVALDLAVEVAGMVDLRVHRVKPAH